MPSRSADEVIARARECYELDLITQEKLEYVTKRAETEPGYDAIIDLPLYWDVDHERHLRLKAKWRARLHRIFRLGRP